MVSVCGSSSEAENHRGATETWEQYGEAEDFKDGCQSQESANNGTNGSPQGILLEHWLSTMGNRGLDSRQGLLYGVLGNCG